MVNFSPADARGNKDILVITCDDVVSQPNERLVNISQYIGVPFFCRVNTPDGMLITQWYNPASGRVGGELSKLAPSYNGELAKVPWGYTPDTGEYSTSPGNYLTYHELDCSGWDVIKTMLEHVLDPYVKADDVRACFHKYRPDLKIKVSHKPNGIQIKVNDEDVTFYALTQLLVQGEIILR